MSNTTAGGAVSPVPMLQSIRIENFKGVGDLTLALKRVNVLIGSNNAGKSSVLQALQFAVSVAQSAGLESTIWIGDRLSSTLSSQQLVYSPLRDIQALAAGGRLRQHADKAIRLTLTTDTHGTGTISVRRGKNKNIAITIDGASLGKCLQDIETPFSVFVPGLAGIPSYEELRSPGVVRRAAARGDANSVFRNVLWLLHKDSIAWNQFKEDLQDIFPGTDVDLKFEESIDEHIDVVIKVNDVELPIDSSGTGVLQAIQILAYVNVYHPTVLILDEPDSHLHPDNQRKLARLLLRVSERRDFQVILSTHSRHLLDEFSGTDAKIHWLSGGTLNPEENLDRVAILLDLGALDVGDRLRHGGTPCVALTEDAKPLGFRVLLESAGIDPNNVDLWSYKGCTKIDTAIVLASFIQDHAPGTKVLLHRDRDYLLDNERDEFVAELEKKGMTVFVTEGVDVESHFLKAAHVSHLVPELTMADSQSIIDTAQAETAEASIEHLVNARHTAAQRERNKNGGSQPNTGKIAGTARGEYEADPVRYRHGKTVLRAVAAAVQKRVGRNVNLLQHSPHLANNELADFGKTIASP